MDPGPNPGPEGSEPALPFSPALGLAPPDPPASAPLACDLPLTFLVGDPDEPKKYFFINGEF